jgi:signal transduction histidine kinase
VRQATWLRRHGFDIVIVALAVSIQLEIALTDVPGQPIVLVPAGLLSTLPLLLRRSLPFVAPVIVFAVHIAISFTDPHAVGAYLTGEIALAAAFWVAGAWNDEPRAVAGLLLGLATVAVIAATDDRVSTNELVNGWLLATTTWGVALALQMRARRVAVAEERAGRAERERDERTRRAVSEERRRIARELHDVVAHTVSVMTVQAGAARMLLSGDPGRAKAPLLAVEDTGHQALVELRRLLGVLRADDPAGTVDGESALAPQPGLDDLPALIESVRAAGLPVELITDGASRTLPAGVALAAYRIVQESLTNCLKHAGPARSLVRVRLGSDAVDLEVVDDGYGGEPSGQGHGLVGMAERASIFGGGLSAGPLPQGGFAVRAHLPLESVPS